MRQPCNYLSPSPAELEGSCLWCFSSIPVQLLLARPTAKAKLWTLSLGWRKFISETMEERKGALIVQSMTLTLPLHVAKPCGSSVERIPDMCAREFLLPVNAS